MLPMPITKALAKDLGHQKLKNVRSYMSETDILSDNLDLNYLVYLMMKKYAQKYARRLNYQNQSGLKVLKLTSDLAIFHFWKLCGRFYLS